jgi:hypothetical protein
MNLFDHRIRTGLAIGVAMASMPIRLARWRKS